MGNTLRNKVIQFHEKIVFDFLKKIRNYLVANPIFSDRIGRGNERIVRTIKIRGPIAWDGSLRSAGRRMEEEGRGA